MGNNMESSLLNNVDTEKLDVLVHNTTVGVKQYEDICLKVVKQYTDGLDNLMKDLYQDCIKPQNATTSMLENYYLELSNYVYFMIERVEDLGVFSDISAEAFKEVYSKSYINLSTNKDVNGKNKNTVSEIQAMANMESQYESVVKSIYERAYKIVKGKIASAQDMMNCIRKILTTRTSEMQLSMGAANRQVSGD